MVSGAGRKPTFRSFTAYAARRVTDRGSRRYAAAFTAATIALSPLPSNVPESAANSSSTAHRSSTDKHAVSFTNKVARHSFNCPVSNAANVRGISPTRAFANPNNRDPLFGDSRRANAT